MIDFHPGKYRLRASVTNPDGQQKSEDWRHKPSFEEGEIFFGLWLYVSMNREVPAFYQGQRRDQMVTAETWPRVFNAITPYLEVTK